MRKTRKTRKTTNHRDVRPTRDAPTARPSRRVERYLMTTKLRISRTLALPLGFVTSTCALLGQKRVGKSYKASVLAEELLDADQQVVIVDPTSAWWGLRSSANGR